MSKLTIINKAKITTITRPSKEFNIVTGESGNGTIWAIWRSEIVASLFPEKLGGFVKFKYLGNPENQFNFRVFNEDTGDLVYSNGLLSMSDRFKFQKNFINSQKPKPGGTLAQFIVIYCPDENTEEIIQPLVWKYL